MTAGDISGSPAGVLSGCRVLVTRAAHQARSLAEPLEDLGAEVIIAPAIETVDPDDWAPVDEAIDRLASYDWTILTSANAVERFLARVRQRRADDRLAGARIAVVGPGTASRLAELGITPALVPDDDFRAEGVLAGLLDAGVGPGSRVLLPRAAKAREILPDQLREAGAAVDVVVVYRTVPAAADPAVIERLRSGDIDVVTFTSPSTVSHFIAWLEASGLDPDSVMRGLAAASIGPVTTEALVARGYVAAIEAPQSTVGHLVEAVGAFCAAHGPGR